MATIEQMRDDIDYWWGELQGSLAEDDPELIVKVCNGLSYALEELKDYCTTREM